MAITYLKLGEKIAPNDPRILFGLGKAFFNGGDQVQGSNISNGPTLSIPASEIQTKLTFSRSHVLTFSRSHSLTLSLSHFLTQLFENSLFSNDQMKTRKTKLEEIAFTMIPLVGPV